MTTWSNDDLIEFIELFREQEPLWKIRHKDYHNNVKRTVCYNVLLEKMKIIDRTADLNKVKKKINNLRTVFRKELKKQNDSLLSGSSADEVYSPKLSYFENLMFLKDQEMPREGESSTKSDLQDQGDGDYAMDGSEDWGDDDLDTGTIRPQLGVTPSAIIRQDPGFREAPAFRNPSLSAIDPMAATNERPRVIDDSSLSALERRALRHAAFKNMKMVVHAGRCLTPQARWLPVRQMAPAANVVYMPPCVQLHRCAPDSGCCHKEDEVCAPVDGRYVAIPFYLHKADGKIEVSRMLFYNHTRCACVARETLQRRADVGRAERDHAGDVTDFRVTEEPLFTSADDEPSAEPTLMRRCTCPALFLAKMSESNCSCVCEWPEPSRRRECLSLSRGREHFGLRDRVCVANGDCAAPACEYGPYERTSGRCPLRRFRRIRYRGGSRLDKGIVVEG